VLRPPLESRPLVPPAPLAEFGSEKMIYDLRMGPQAVADGNRVIVVYQGGEGVPVGHPHVAVYDRALRRWSPGFRVGEAAGRDHHFAPILWRDGRQLWHILYNCHFSPGTHLVSRRPEDPTAWQPAPAIAPSISYPTVWTLSGGRRLLFYRVEGHLGYWVYRLSRDGGATWEAERLLLDFSYQARDEVDRWAGEYASLAVDPDGSTVHLGFSRWFHCELLKRYSLYYLQLDPETGRLTSSAGEDLTPPVNRRAAEACKVHDTGWELTNFPALAADGHGRVAMIAPISQDDPWRCRFHCFVFDGGAWRHTEIVDTDNVWNAARIVSFTGRRLVADLVVGHGKGEECFYGGGELQRWTSDDGGRSWQAGMCFVPRPGLLYNNPSAVRTVEGGFLEGAFVFYGWTGPGGVWALPDFATEDRNRGQAWLWLDGHWA